MNGTTLTAAQINPYIRAAEIQNAVLEGEGERCAYDFRIFYILSNDGEIVIEGTAYPIKMGTLIFIPPAVGYRFRGRMSVAVLNFDMSRVAEDRCTPICPPMREKFQAEKLFDGTRAVGLEQPLTLFESGVTREEIVSLIHTWNEKSEWSDALTSAGLKGILIRLLQGNTSKPDAREAVCAKIQSYIHLNADRVMDNRSIAKHLGYHPVYLGEVFKERTGRTLHQAILDEKVGLAKRWLLQTNATVDEIAEEIGFSSRSHFCTIFKQYTGTTPLAYRKAHAERGM